MISEIFLRDVATEEGWTVSTENVLLTNGKDVFKKYLISASGGNTGYVGISQNVYTIDPPTYSVDAVSGGYAPTTAATESFYKRGATATYTVSQNVGCWGSSVLSSGSGDTYGYSLINLNMIGRVFGHNSSSSRTVFYDSANLASGSGTVTVAGTLALSAPGHYWNWVDIDTGGAGGVATYYLSKRPYYGYYRAVNTSYDSFVSNTTSGYCCLGMYNETVWQGTKFYDGASFRTTFVRTQKDVSNNTYYKFLSDTLFNTNDVYVVDSNTAWYAGSTGAYLASYASITQAISVTKYTTANGLPSNVCTGVVVDSTNVWVGTDTGLAKGIYGVWTTKTADNVAINSLVMDSSSIIWYGTSSGLVKYNTLTDTRTLYTTSTSPALPSNNVNTGYKCVAVDSLNNVWLAYGSASVGLSYFNTTADIITTYTTADGIPSNYVQGIFVDIYNRPVIFLYGGTGSNTSWCGRSAGTWTTFATGESTLANWHDALCAPDGTYMGQDRRGISSASNYAGYSVINTPVIYYGWSGSGWVADSKTPKTTHTNAQGILDGMTIQFDTETYVATNFYNWACSTGIVKDNLQEMTVNRNWYSTKMLQATESQTIALVTMNGFTDPFSSLDTTNNWKVSRTTTDTTATVVSGQVILANTYANALAAKTAEIRHYNLLFGDFDVQIDVDVTSQPTASVWYNRFYVATEDETKQIGIGNVANNSNITAFGVGTSSSWSNTATAGTGIIKFRVKRVSTTYTVYYDVGAGWVLLQSAADTNLSNLPLHVDHYLQVSSLYPLVTSKLDNFTINIATNVGKVIITPKQTDPDFLLLENSLTVTVTIDAVPATRVYTTPTAGQFYVSKYGDIFFNLADVGKTAGITYYYLKR